MSARKLPTPDVLKRLLVVIHTRQSSADQKLRVELASLQKIEQEIGERQAKVDKLDSDLLALQKFLAGDTSQSVKPVDAADYQLGLTQRYWINYDLERERYYLDMTHDEHCVQLKKVLTARNEFKILKYKHDTLSGKLRSTKLSQEASQARNEDAERQNFVRRSVL